MRLLSVFCILMLLSCGLGENKDIIVMNSGFESVVENLPLHWSYIGFFEPEVAFFVDSDKANNGRNSASIKIIELTNRLNEFGPPNWAQNVSDNIPVGRDISLSAYIASENVQGIAVIALQCIDKDGQIVGFGTTQYESAVSGDSDWTKVGFNMTVHENTQLMRILCILAGTGQVWFDDVNINRVK